jgi:succinoglycan biosynthesis protein ExoM
VTVCVPTCRRPVMLRRLLSSLADLVPPAGARVAVVVVDNDARESARAVVDDAAALLPWPVVYLVEPVRNISLARNRGIARALEMGAAFVAFVDDDETVHRAWLAELLAVQAAHGADVVSGPAEPRLPPSAPDWLVRTGLFAAPRAATGSPVAFPNMFNSLVAAPLLRALPGPFDPEFGLTGGSDSLFFTRCHRGGAVMVAADGAVVDDWVPATRTTARWVLQRAFRVGNTAARVERHLPREQRRMAARVLAGSARLLAGALQALPAAVLGRGPLVRALWNVCYGAGCLSGLAGYRYVEYRRLHGE